MDAHRPDLKDGDQGDDVVALQQRLLERGHSPGAVDGWFGPRTEAAVRSFQEATGCAVDGWVGPETWGALGGGGPAAPATVGQDEFQQAVGADGWVAPEVDGVAVDSPVLADSGFLETLVVVGTKVIELIDSDASINSTSYVSVHPEGVDPSQLGGWSSTPNRLEWHAFNSSEWWRIWDADYAFTVGISYYWWGSRNGHGRYLDYVSPYLTVEHLPPDFTVDVRVTFPDHAMNRGNGVAALPFELDVTMKGVFGHSVFARRRASVLIDGTGYGRLTPTA